MLQRLSSIGALTIMVLSGVGAAIIGFSATRPALPPQRVWVQIVRVGLNQSRFRQYVIVDYATADGLTGEVTIPADMFSCRVGDTVPAVKRGVSVFLPPPECRRAHGSAQ